MLPGEAYAAMHLQVDVVCLLCAFDRRQFGCGAGKAPVGQAAVERGGCVKGRQARVVERHPGIGQLVLDGLVAADRLAKLFAFARIGAGHIERGCGRA